MLSCAVSCRAFAVAGDDVGLCDGRVFAISYAVVLCVLPQCLFDGLDSIFPQCRLVFLVSDMIIGGKHRLACLYILPSRNSNWI